jgi:hypothetical protein
MTPLGDTPTPTPTNPASTPTPTNPASTPTPTAPPVPTQVGGMLVLSAELSPGQSLTLPFQLLPDARRASSSLYLELSAKRQGQSRRGLLCTLSFGLRKPGGLFDLPLAPLALDVVHSFTRPSPPPGLWAVELTASPLCSDDLEVEARVGRQAAAAAAGRPDSWAAAGLLLAGVLLLLGGRLRARALQR